MFLKHQSRGQEFDLTAGRHNAIADATNDFLQRKFRRGGVTGIADARTLVSVTNGTGANWAIGHAVAIGTPTTTPATSEELFLNRLIFSGTRPVTGSFGAFGICVEPIPNGAVGYVALGGVVAAKVVVPSNGTWIEFADVTNDSYELTLRPEGTSRVLWRVGGTSGSEWAVIQLGVSAGNRYLKGKTDATITAGSSGTVSVWRNGSDTSFNVTGYLNWMDGSEDISGDREVVLHYFEDEAKWVITNAECEA